MLADGHTMRVLNCIAGAEHANGRHRFHDRRPPDRCGAKVIEPFQEIRRLFIFNQLDLLRRRKPVEFSHSLRPSVGKSSAL